MVMIGGKKFDTEQHGYIVGILNITPDSFSDGGKYNNLDSALKRVRQMIDEGASVIDVGGESYRPGFQSVTVQEEIERVSPVIEKIKREFDIPISLDTHKSEVAKACIPLGVDIINDIWGLRQDNEMAGVIAESGCVCCLMHNRRSDVYGDFMGDVSADMRETLQIARDAGIDPDKIILDPGIGFAKDQEQNLELLANLERFCALGHPVLLGVSRKSVVGYALDLPVSERLEGTLATTVIGRLKGACFFRVHDVQENYRALKMTDAIKNHNIFY